MAETTKPFFCGGFSACFASAVIHPIDLIKVSPWRAEKDARTPKTNDSSVLKMHGRGSCRCRRQSSTAVQSPRSSPVFAVCGHEGSAATVAAARARSSAAIVIAGAAANLARSGNTSLVACRLPFGPLDSPSTSSSAWSCSSPPAMAARSPTVHCTVSSCLECTRQESKVGRQQGRLHVRAAPR